MTAIDNAKLVLLVGDLAGAVRSLLWPASPSADDFALLVRMSGRTLDEQEPLMELVERVRAAQAKASAVLRKAEAVIA